MRPDDFLDRFYRERAVAVLRTPDHDAARAAMEAAVDGGFRILEFTLGCPRPYDLIAEFSGRDGLTVGAGTVLTADQARRCLDAGAAFVVSPVFDPAVVAVARQADVAMMPGAVTPTEMVTAWRAGAQLQKLFPAPSAGPAWVRACLGPLPFLRIVPTSGVAPDNVAGWIDAGVWGVGFVASLFDPGLIDAGDWTGIEENARRCLEAARKPSRPDRPPAGVAPFDA